MAEPLVLGVETSCDETSAAVLCGTSIRGHVILSQDAHAVYGGVVPEIAARAHLAALDDVVATALRQAGATIEDIDIFCATAGPGLIGALLVGLTWTKSAAFAIGRPFVGVHHMEAHLFATALEHPDAQPPFVGLLVSGGHTMLLWVPAWGEYTLLGQTRDDAAGEAFDKVAKILGLGFPGGPEVQRLAAAGDPAAYRLPRPMLAASQRIEDDEFFDFSFSGLKTAVLTLVRETQRNGNFNAERANLAASFQAAAVDVLTAKTLRAVEHTGAARVVLGGGVASSRPLQQALRSALGPDRALFVPPSRLATDNAAMVAAAGAFRYRVDGATATDATARADLPFPGLRARGAAMETAPW